MGKKISEFLAWGNQAIPDSGNITFTYNGVNYKQTYQNFIGNLGVTGSIEQDGAVTGTPILDIQGTVNKIRNLEGGSGIKTSVSAENGATIEHDFIEDTNGVELVVDLTADQPKFRSIVGGSGINVSRSNGTIIIAESAIPATTKTVVVNQLSDFPAASGGVITLDADTEYAVRNDISTADRFVLSNNTVISGSDSVVVGLTYTGVGVMYTATSANCKIKDITNNCTSGTFLDYNGSGTEIFQLLDSAINCATFGNMDDLGGAHFDDCIINATAGGLTFGGSNNIILIEAISSTIDAGTLFDLGTSTFNGFSLTDCFTTLNGSSVFLDGAAASANINVGGLGSAHNCRLSGTGTALQAITEEDIRWQFFINDDIPDTHKDILLSQIGNLTATTINTAGVPEKLAGTWTEEHSSQFSSDAAGKMTYIGVKDTHFDLTFSFTAEPVSGTNKDIVFYAFKNGVEITNSAAGATISAGGPKRITLVWRVTLTNGDYIEAFVENNTDTVDVLMSDGILRIS